MASRILVVAQVACPYLDRAAFGLFLNAYPPFSTKRTYISEDYKRYARSALKMVNNWFKKWISFPIRKARKFLPELWFTLYTHLPITLREGSSGSPQDGSKKASLGRNSMVPRFLLFLSLPLFLSTLLFFKGFLLLISLTNSPTFLSLFSLFFFSSFSYSSQITVCFLQHEHSFSNSNFY